MSQNPYEPPQEDQRPPRLNLGRFRHLLLVPFFAVLGAIPGVVHAAWSLFNHPPQSIEAWLALPAMALAGLIVGGLIGLVGAILDIIRYR